MFGKKKRKENKGLPDLPPLDEPVRLRGSRIQEEKEEEPNNLPTFPDSPDKKGFSQSAIKDAVRSHERQDLPELPDFKDSPEPSHNKNFRTIEMEEWSPPNEEPPVSREIEEKAIPPIPEDHPHIESQKSSDIFVKLEKFNSAKRSLEGIENKLEDISSLLSKIRETKMREEQELSAWERDVASIKAEVQEVTQNIFEKLE